MIRVPVGEGLAGQHVTESNMSYRLITKAVFAVTSSAGIKTERTVEARLYVSPKRDASGEIQIDGQWVPYKRTGGKGRGTADQRYMYATVKGQSAFWPITEAEASALIGGTCSLTSVVEQAAAEPEAPKAEAAPAAKPEGQKAKRVAKAHA